MRDLDQSDVDRDARDMRDSYLERLAEDLDGADLPTVIDCIISHTGDDWGTFINSPLGEELIRSTQSNPSRAYDTLREIARVIGA